MLRMGGITPMSIDLLVLIAVLVGLVLLDLAAVRWGVVSRGSNALDPAQPARRNI
jgi:hypothetical protein